MFSTTLKAGIMLINRLYIPESEAAEFGLQEIDMPRLGHFVALAGKNGAGKTRLLSRLEYYVAFRATRIHDVPNLRRAVEGWSAALREILNDTDRNNFTSGIKNNNQAIDLTLNRINSGNSGKFLSLRFVPKGLNALDPRQVTPAKMRDLFAQAESASVEKYEECFLAHIQQRQNRHWNATHQGTSASADQISTEKNAYNHLCNTIEALLGIRLDRDLDGNATLFGKPIADAQLSDGQKIALQLAVALHAQSRSLNNTVFLLDEPENHLHPSVTIDLLDRLQKAAPKAQFWIATHSIPLLAYVHSIEPTALWYMEDGKVSHAGRHPERVLASLLGDEARLSQLHAFTGLPAMLAMTNFAAECLLPPRTVGAETGDSQTIQISRILKGLATDRPLRVLDYGAGKGRLLDGVAEMVAPDKVSDSIDYFAYDPSPDDREACKAVISQHLGSEGIRHFASDEAFFKTIDDGSIDVVVMCNVFHEIPPGKWNRLFDSRSLIGRALHNGGYLLLVEDQRIPVGEKAHKHGFLVLDTPQLKTLFGITSADAEQFVVDDQRSDGRLKAHLISKALLGRLSTESRNKAIHQVLESALTKIESIREEKHSYSNGQLHGFWTQQLANAYMFTRENP